jgi:hypothetical protein
MLTLYSYPPLFGVADNSGYGLKVFAFLKLAGVPFRHEHIFDASKAPCGQLPYIIFDRNLVAARPLIFRQQRLHGRLECAGSQQFQLGGSGRGCAKGGANHAGEQQYLVSHFSLVLLCP